MATTPAPHAADADADADAGACPVCGATEIVPPRYVGRDRMQGTPGTFTVVTCARCGSGRTLPIVAPEALAAYYAPNYHAHSLQRGALFRLVWSLGQKMRWASDLRTWPLDVVAKRPAGAALDIGSGRGDLGAALTDRGWTVTGIDPSSDAVELAVERGLEAHVGTVHTVDLGTGRFDAVTMMHALEHVPDPRRDLERARDLLKPGGVLVVVVPNYGAWARRRFGARWFHLDLPRHRQHFTAPALQLLAESVGFEEVRTGDQTDPGALIGSLQYRFFERLVLAGGWKSGLWQVASLVSPVMRLVDRAGGEGDLLCLTARRGA